MRVMILATSSAESESKPPASSSHDMEAMGRFHQELTDAGVLLASERLLPSSSGARVRFVGASRRVTDGPFVEAKEIVAGYWIWQVDSWDDAIEWLKRAPFQGGEFEIRQIMEWPAPAE